MTATDWIVRVAQAFGVSATDLMSNKRQKHIAIARHAAFLLLRQQSYLSLAAIGELFGRDHTTVLYGVNTAIERMAQDTHFAALVEEARHDPTR